MSETFNQCPTSAVPLEVVDASGQPIAELEITPRDAIVLSAAVASTEGPLRRRHDKAAIRDAEDELGLAVRLATARSWRGAGAKAIEADPDEVAERYVYEIQGQPLNRSFLAPETASEPAEDDTVRVSAADLFDDDEEEGLLPEAGFQAVPANAPAEVAWNAKLSRRAQEALVAEELEAETQPPVISMETARIVVEALKARIRQVEGDPLQGEIEEIGQRVEAALPSRVTDPSWHQRLAEHARRVHPISGSVGMTALARLIGGSIKPPARLQ